MHRRNEVVWNDSQERSLLGERRGLVLSDHTETSSRKSLSDNYVTIPFMMIRFCNVANHPEHVRYDRCYFRANSDRHSSRHNMNMVPEILS